MKSIPIRTRLTALFFVILALALVGFAVFALHMMRQSIDTAVDEQLEDQSRNVQSLIARASDRDVADELREHAELQAGTELLQVSDSSGKFIYRSSAMKRMDIPASNPNQLQVADATYGDLPVRILATTVSADGRRYVIQVATPMDDYMDAVERFRLAMWVAIPGLLLAAAGGGYWMSAFAMRPVDQITRAAQRITPQDLSQRVTVPSTRDELQRLAETINQMLQRIESSVKRITEFTADASHELRTPVSLIRTRAEVTLANPRTGDEYREALRDVLAESERITTLIENLMLLARTDSGTETLRFEDIDLAVLAREVSTQGRTLAAAKRLQWANELPTSSVWVRGDQQALRRLLLILIDNAVKYTPQDGQVALSLKRNERHAELYVQDTGIGIPDNDLPRIFERFYRADKARSRELGGTGLGLSIGRWIANSHGGEIKVESSVPGRTVFLVRIPLVA